MQQPSTARHPAPGPHGLCAPGAGRTVCFPSGCAAAASFDTGLLRRLGASLGELCAAAGADLLMGPEVNLKRSPLCGFGAETLSEDPYLAGELAAAFVEGVQGQGVGACPRRFAAASQRYHSADADARVEERTLRELYLPAFERVIKQAAPAAVQCAAGPVNGARAEQNNHLMDILQREWGFAGAVLPADYGADTPLPRQAVPMDRAAHHKKAAEMEKECAVLLKNRGVLPLKAEQSVVYIGEFAAKPRIQGGTGRVEPSVVTDALDIGGKKGRRVHYEKGFPAGHDERDEGLFLRAVEAARAADAAVIFAGLPESFENGSDRRHLRLPECQNNLIARVAAVQPNTVVVLHCGGPVECPWVQDVAAVLCMYLGGEGVGEAADALLYGEANPCGRLPESWPMRLQDTPSYLEYPGDGRTARYTEGVFVGYRWYDAREMPVLWPFGHGLSYTGFIYRNARLSAPELEPGGRVTVSVDVKNTGALPGKEVVQLYVAPPRGEGMAPRPPKELKGFAKAALAPGEEITLCFAVDERSLSFYDETRGGWYAAPGRYQMMLGHSSRDIHATAELGYAPGGPQRNVAAATDKAPDGGVE